MESVAEFGQSVGWVEDDATDLQRAEWLNLEIPTVFLEERGMEIGVPELTRVMR